MFINLSNHPSESWDIKQKEAAGVYGDILDLPFPQILAMADESEVMELAKSYCERILEYGRPVVMVQGEFTFTHYLANMLKERKITSLASCSQRRTREWKQEDGKQVKQSVFEFVRFREY